MAQPHARRSAAQRAKARQQRLLQGAFRRLGAASAFDGMAEHLTGAAVDDRHKHTPAIAAAMDQCQISRPALIGAFGDRTGGFDPWTSACAPLGQRPALELHDAMDLLAVDPQAITEAQAAPGAAHAAVGLFLMQPADACHQRLIQATGRSLPWLIVGGARGRPNQWQSLTVERVVPDTSRVC